MSDNSPENGASIASLRAWHGWWPLAVTLSLSAILVAIILRGRGDKPNIPPMPGTPPNAAISARVRMLPGPVSEAALAIDDVHTTHYRIVSEDRDGVQVLRIRTHAEGDELIVDASTGRLVAVRDCKGKTVPWPASPMSAIEHPAKAS
jgi:hypothetical protein